MSIGNLLFHIGNLLFHTVSSIMIIYFLGSKFEWKTKMHRAEKVIVFIIFTALLSCMSIITGNGGIKFLNLMILHSLFMLFYLYLYKKGTMIEKIYWVTLIQCISSCVTLIAYFALSKHIPLENVTFYIGDTRFRFIRIFILIIQYISLFSVTTYSPKLSYLGPTVLIYSILVNVFWMFVVRSLIHISDFRISILAAIVLLLSNIIYFVMVDLLSKNINKLAEIEIDYQNMKLKTKYYEEVELINQEVKKYRHDLANHFNMLYYLVDINNTEEAKRYLDSMAIDLKNIHKGFYYIETGNQSVDFILNSKVLVARENGIETHTNVGDMTHLFVSSPNLCTLLANLLDNSIEACQLFKKDKPFIEINMQIIKKNCLINIKNSSNPIKVDKKGNYITNKEIGDHGFGISQINRIIKQYNGYVCRKYENDVFETNILLVSPTE